MKWIWLDGKIYPEYQKNYYSICHTNAEEQDTYAYCVAEFKKELALPKKSSSIYMRITADSFYHLYINDEIEGIGPPSSGGDFLETGILPKYYANNHTIDICADKIEIIVMVRLLPEVLTDYSRYHGGLAIEGEIFLEDGSMVKFGTDSTWLCRPDSAYTGFQTYDNTTEMFPYSAAAEIRDIWQAEDSHIPPLSLNEVLHDEIIALPGSNEVVFSLGKIYGVYPVISADGPCRITAVTRELEGQSEMMENVILCRAGEYFSFRQHSCGEIRIGIENESDTPVRVKIRLIAPWYPIEKEGFVITSNIGYNKAYEVCKHTLKICRQSIHLDSTKHQEHLACTGDYYIESLITMFAYGDMRLAEFDLMRTADWLVKNDGRMFHTTYSLVWIQMLRDVYMATGNDALLVYCRTALEKLLNRFEGYKGESGVIENPPDYMFVDWTVIDGYNMHHPPKALGQTVLNAFYYEALVRAAEIYDYLYDTDFAEKCRKNAQKFYIDFNREFFDDSQGLYFDGKNDDTGEAATWLPSNSKKRYFSKYPNILSCLYGLTEGEKAEKIMRRVITDDTLQDIQPYFMHYMLGAVKRTGLFPEYGWRLLDRWVPMVENCDKGLAEGWIAPTPTYSFDHSHAWGGTFAYYLPLMLTGFEIIEPGMKKIKLDPCLLGLEYASVKIPTGYGDILIEMNQDGTRKIIVPEGIKIQ